jgi:nucleoside phosphorylase
LNVMRSLVAWGLLFPPFLFADTAILVALSSELDGVRKEVRLVGQGVELAGRSVFIAYRKGEKIYIVRTGAGIMNAAMTTQALLARHKVDRVISIGVAGNLSEQWAVGDVLIATEVVSHQEGKETPAGFEVKQRSAISGQLSAECQGKCRELRREAVETAQQIAAGMLLTHTELKPET